MQTIHEEIINFVGLIGKQEIKRNPKLKSKVSALLKRIESLTRYSQANYEKRDQILSFLDSKSLLMNS